MDLGQEKRHTSSSPLSSRVTHEPLHDVDFFGADLIPSNPTRPRILTSARNPKRQHGALCARRFCLSWRLGTKMPSPKLPQLAKHKHESWVISCRFAHDGTFLVTRMTWPTHSVVAGCSDAPNRPEAHPNPIGSGPDSERAECLVRTPDLTMACPDVWPRPGT